MARIYLFPSGKEITVETLRIAEKMMKLYKIDPITGNRTGVRHNETTKNRKPPITPNNPS